MADENKMEQVIDIKGNIKEFKKSMNEASKDLKNLNNKAKLDVTPSSSKTRKQKINETKEQIKSQREQNSEKKKAIEITRELNSLMRASAGSDEKRKAEVKAWRREVQKLEKEYAKISQSGGDTTKVGEDLKNAYTELNKAIGNSKIGVFQKLINTFKRVGFYRLARRLFQVIEQGLGKGIRDLIEFDNTANNAFSSLSSSAEKISASVALVLMPAIEAVVPFVNTLSNSFVDFANSISEANAQMQGLATYTKISDKYLKDLRETSNTLSFDKFESLNAKSSPYETGKVDPDKDLSSYKSIINTIQVMIRGVGETLFNIFDNIKIVFNMIKPYFNDLIKLLENVLIISTSLIFAITEIVVKVVDWLEKNDLLETAIWGVIGAILVLKTVQLATTIANIVSWSATAIQSLGALTIQLGKSIVKFLQTEKAVLLLKGALAGIAMFASFKVFDDVLKNAPKWVAIISSIAGAIATLAVVILATTQQWAKAVALPAIAISAGLMVAGLKNSIETYANGGMVDRGSLFIAGEAGAELVTQMPSGQTGVTNVSQFKQAMVEALYECSDIFQQGDGSVVLNLDGAELARSKRFKSELNRTNAGLNLR